jgi:hypothetical protein
MIVLNFIGLTLEFFPVELGKYFKKNKCQNFRGAGDPAGDRSLFIVKRSLLFQNE